MEIPQNEVHLELLKRETVCELCIPPESKPHLASHFSGVDFCAKIWVPVEA